MGGRQSVSPAIIIETHKHKSYKICLITKLLIPVAKKSLQM